MAQLGAKNSLRSLGNNDFGVLICSKAGYGCLGRGSCQAGKASRAEKNIRGDVNGRSTSEE